MAVKVLDHLGHVIPPPPLGGMARVAAPGELIRLRQCGGTVLTARGYWLRAKEPAFNPRNVMPLTAAPNRRHRRPEPSTPGEGFILGENAQSGVSRHNGGVRGGRPFR